MTDQDAEKAIEMVTITEEIEELIEKESEHLAYTKEFLESAYKNKNDGAIVLLAEMDKISSENKIQGYKDCLSIVKEYYER